MALVRQQVSNICDRNAIVQRVEDEVFSKAVYLDGWQLFWRLKWRYVQLLCFEMFLLLLLPTAGMLGLSLVPSIIGNLVFWAAY